MNYKKIGFIYGFFTIFLLIFLEVLKSTIPDILIPIHNILYIPIEWLTNLEPPNQENKPASAFSLFVLSSIYILILIGVIMLCWTLWDRIFKKEIGSTDANIETKPNFPQFQKFCEEDLGKAVRSLEDGSETQSDFAVFSYLKEFELQARVIFNLDADDQKYYWYVGHGRSFILISFKPGNTESAKQLIQSSLSQEDVRIAEKNLKERDPECPFESFISTRNFGKLKLGFAMTITKKDVINEYNLQEFEMLATNLLLLGFNSKFITAVKRIGRAG